MDLDRIQSLWTAPQSLQNIRQHHIPKTHALNVEVLNMVLFIAPLTNVGNAIRLPQDIANINVWNTPEISLMFLKTGITTMITYLLMQIIANLVNAESPID